MTFELMRLNWPNTAAILALAVVPAMSLATYAKPGPSAVRVIADATDCPLPRGTVVALATVPTSFLE